MVMIHSKISELMRVNKPTILKRKSLRKVLLKFNSERKRNMMFQATMRDLPLRIRVSPSGNQEMHISLWHNVHPQVPKWWVGKAGPWDANDIHVTYGEFGEPTRPSNQQIQGPRYWADVVSYPRHPEVTPSPWHTGLPQANRKLPQGPNPIGTLVPRHRWFGKQSS